MQAYDGETEIETGKPYQSRSFTIIVVNSVATITQLSTGVELIYDKENDNWEIIVPVKLSGNTEGLCGIADGKCENDFWMGTYAVKDVAAFFNHWLVNDDGAESCKVDALDSLSATAIAASYCSELFNGAIFGHLNNIVPNSEYIETCAKTTVGISMSKDWPGCSALSAYADACAQTGLCVKWRSDNLCPYKSCTGGSVYDSCGPNMEKTCSNYKVYAAVTPQFNAEGCFCPVGTVSQQNVQFLYQ